MFKDPEAIHFHLSVCASVVLHYLDCSDPSHTLLMSLCQLYLQKHIQIDPVKRSVAIGEYLNWFYVDFGRSRMDALSSWMEWMDSLHIHQVSGHTP